VSDYSPDHTTSNEGDLKCLQDLQATDPRDNKKTFEAVSEKLSGEDYTNRIILPPDMKLAESNPPVSTITLCDNLEFEESLEWFTKSPEYRTWSTNEDEASLWLHGRPAEGKTSTAAYVLKSLEKGYHPKGWAVASIFCSSNDSEVGLVTSLAFQLIRRNDDRAQVVQEKMPITNIQKYERIGQEFERNMWQLLETSIMAGTNYETIIMIDGLDTLSVHKRSSFLDNFLKFQKHVQRSTTIRVFISSRTYPDIEEALAHYSSIEKDKERKGKYF
jgi:Cdc6-like AAA superfamily ATPase